MKDVVARAAPQPTRETRGLRGYHGGPVVDLDLFRTIQPFSGFNCCEAISVYSCPFAVVSLDSASFAD